MVFVNGFLYVAAYDRYTTPERKQITKINPSTGKIVETYECDSMFGGIGYYGNNKFIVLNYEQLAGEPAFSPDTALLTLALSKMEVLILKKSSRSTILFILVK